MEYIKAFLVGGCICAVVQILLDRTKLMPGRVMVLLVVSGAILGFAGIYEPFSKWAGAGATVPLTGFGYALAQGVKRAVEEQGLFGAIAGGLTATAAGVTTAVTLGLLAALVGKSGDKA